MTPDLEAKLTYGCTVRLNYPADAKYQKFYDTNEDGSLAIVIQVYGRGSGRAVNAIRETGMECSKWSCRWFRWCAWVSASVPVPERSRQNAGSSTQESTPEASSAHQDEDGK